MSEVAHQIPDKLYFRIGEVAKLLGVEPYVLRYWETEFPEIAPAKSKSKQRLYKKQDVELIVHVKDLLYNQNYTIKGAKRKIKDFRTLLNKGNEEIKEIRVESLKNTDGVSPELFKSLNDIVGEMAEFIDS